MSPSQTGTPHGHLPENCWHPTTVRRTGAPPLRFKGRAVTRHSASVGGDTVSITLWRKKSGGYTAAVIAAAVVSAASGRDLHELIEWLETVCQTEAPFGPDKPVGDFLKHAPGALLANRQLRLLAGQALNAWDRLLESDGSRSARERTTYDL